MAKILKRFSTQTFGGFIELKRFEKKGQKWNKVIKHIVRIPEGCDDCIQYLRDLIHQDDTYRARDDYRYDHRFFYFMANNDRYKLSDKLEAKRQEIEYEFRPEQEEKTESAPYVAKTEDGAELNPANKGEKMFSKTWVYHVGNIMTKKKRTLEVEADSREEATRKVKKLLAPGESINDYDNTLEEDINYYIFWAQGALVDHLVLLANKHDLDFAEVKKVVSDFVKSKDLNSDWGENIAGSRPPRNITEQQRQNLLHRISVADEFRSCHHINKHVGFKGYDEKGQKVYSEKMFNAEARRDYLLDEARDLPYEVGRAVIDAMQYDEITEAVDRGLVETTDLKQVRDILMKRLRSMKANEIGDFVEQLIDLCTDDAIEDAYDML